MVINLPPGFRFKPRDDELINFYLKPKVAGKKLPCNIINDIELYSPDATPWLLFEIENPASWDDDNSRYVFTSLSKVSNDPKSTTTKSRCNMNKKAGCGTWVQKTSRVGIRDCDGNVIGGRRMLVFQVNEVEDGFDENKAVYFRMHEYSLWGVNEGLASDGCDLVLCKITFDVSKKSPINLLAKKTTDQVSRSGSKAQRKKPSTKNFEGGVSSTSKSVDVMNTGDVIEVSRNSESLVAIDGIVGNDDRSATAPYDIGLQDLDEFLCFGDLGGEGSCFDDLAGEEISKNFEGGARSTLKSVDVMNTSDAIDVSRNLESLAAIDGVVGNDDWSATAPYDIGLQDLDEFLCFDDLGGEGLCFDDGAGEEISLESFDVDGFMQSIQEERQLENRTICRVGKRKSIEGGHSCPAKKMCF